MWGQKVPLAYTWQDECHCAKTEWILWFNEILVALNYFTCLKPSFKIVYSLEFMMQVKDV